MIAAGRARAVQRVGDADHQRHSFHRVESLARVFLLGPVTESLKSVFRGRPAKFCRNSISRSRFGLPVLPGQRRPGRADRNLDRSCCGLFV